HEGGEEGAEEAAHSRDGVEPTRDGAGGLDVRDRKPNREGRTQPEQPAGRNKEQKHAEEGADRGAGRDTIEPFHREVEERPGDERDDGDEAAGDENDSPEPSGRPPAIGKAPTEPVAE